jgi:hypothetical protein
MRWAPAKLKRLVMKIFIVVSVGELFPDNRHKGSMVEICHC